MLDGLARASRAPAFGLLLLTGCMGMPTPLAPTLRGSIGVPHQGVVTDAVRLADRGDGYVRLRKDDMRWGNARLVAAIEQAARSVKHARPQAPPLVVADLSSRHGGAAHGHRSHRTGRDVDLLFYVMSPEGNALRSPGFVRIEPDGLGKVGDKSFVRLDVASEWLLIKALLLAPESHVQWMFTARWVEALLIEYAIARGEAPELVWHAENVLLQPSDSAVHDDHIHLRIACTPEEAVFGCEGGGPKWPWLPELPPLQSPSDAELASWLVDEPDLGVAEQLPATSEAPISSALSFGRATHAGR